MQITGSEAIVRILELGGVEYVFGLCGHANLSMLDALEASSIRFVPVRNEQNAAHMADAYYRFSGKTGVVLTTIGPGLANAVTGIWEAAMDSSSMIVISGNVPSYMIGKDAFQELSMHSDAAQSEVLRPFVKRAWRVAHAASIPHVMQRAFNIARYGNPGPVLVDVPMDFFSAVDDYNVEDPSLHAPTGTAIRGDRQAIERAVEVLMNARRPLIHAGNGCTLSGASQALLALAEHLAIPVSTSMQAQGVIPNTHDLSVGYPGAIGTPTGNRFVREADVVLALGTRFSELETSSWTSEYSFGFGVSAELLQVDIDPHEIGRIYPVREGIIGDARTVLEECLEVAKAQSGPRDAAASPYLATIREARRLANEAKHASARSDAKPMLVQRVIHELGEVMPSNRIILADAGTFRHGVGQFMALTTPASWFLPSGLGTMGGTVAAAIGAKFARPEAAVACLIGEGGFSANDNVIMTAVEWGLPIVWIVLNNYAWDSIRAYQHIHFDDRVYGTALQTAAGRPSNPDFVMLAQAFGAAGAKVSEPGDFKPALEAALAANGPFVLEVEVAPTRLEATGFWDVGDILKREGAVKRGRTKGVADRQRAA